MDTSKPNWWRKLTDCDPISLEPLRRLRMPPFNLATDEEQQRACWFDGKLLANYLISSGSFLHPISRRSLTSDDCLKLDAHLVEHRLGKPGVKHAFDHVEDYKKQQSPENQVLRMQAEADDASDACASSPAAAPPLVIAGDFNCEPHSAAHAMLSARPGDGALGSGAASLKGAVAAAAASLLPLRDAYASCPPPWGPALRSSFRNGRVLDYIFTSSAVEVRRAALPLTPLALPRRRPPTPVALHLKGPLACAAGATHDAGQPHRRLR